MGSGAPHLGHGDTGDRREHHGHGADLVTDLRSSCKRPGTVKWAAVVVPSPHAIVPVLPRGLEEGQVPTGDRLPPVPLCPSFPPSGSDSPTARRALGCPGELRAAPENSAGRSSGSPGTVRQIIPSFHIRPPGRPRGVTAVPSEAFPASAEALVSLSPPRQGQGVPLPKSGRGASFAPRQQTVNAGGSCVPSPAEVGGSQRRYGEQRKAEGGGPGTPPGPGLRERSEK